MENKNIKRMFLLILLTILLLGVVSATNTNDTSTSDKTQHNNIQQPSIEKTKINTGTEHTETKYKQIKKENKTLKKEAYNKSVSNYTQLVDTINEAKTTNYDEYIINLENGDYNATTSMIWGNSAGTKNLTINGNGITFNGQNQYQFIQVNEDYSLILENITLTNFKTYDSGGAIWNGGSLTITNVTLSDNYAGDDGGAIYNKGQLNINNSSFLNNRASDDGGVIYNSAGTVNIDYTTFKNNTAGYWGGVVCNHGDLTINNSKFEKYEARENGGALYNAGTMIVSNSIFDDEYENTFYGGGSIINCTYISKTEFEINTSPIAVRGENITINAYLKDTPGNKISNAQITLTINDVEYDVSTDENGEITYVYRPYDVDMCNVTLYFAGNDVLRSSQANIIIKLFTKEQLENNVINVSSYQELVDAVVLAKSLNFTEYTINLLPGNYHVTGTITWGDSSYVKSLVINGNGNTINGQNQYQFIHVNQDYSLILENITLTNFKSNNDGGAIYSKGTLNIVNSNLTHNNAQRGGAIYNEDGTLNMNNTTLTGNNATSYGGAIYNWGTLIITDSNLIGNNATDVGGAIYNEGTLNMNNTNLTHNTVRVYGGAIYNWGTLIITDSNLIGNNATGGFDTNSVYFEGDGGAIYTFADLTVINCTFTNNTGGEHGAVSQGDYDSNKVYVINSTCDNNTGSSDEQIRLSDDTCVINTMVDGILLNKGFGTRIDSNLKEFMVKEEKLLINGNLEDYEYNEISNTNITLTINDDIIIIPTDDYGRFSYEYDTEDNKNLLISIKYNGNEYYNASEYVILVELLDSSDLENNNVNVTNYHELLRAVNIAKLSDNTEYTINLLPGEYNVTSTITWGDAQQVRTLTINGNGNTIDGQNKYQFIEVNSDYTLVLANITLNNFVAENGGAILSNGPLNVINSSFNNNSADSYGGAIYSSDVTTVINSTFKYNRGGTGGAINQDGGTLNVIDSVFVGDTSYWGGAINIDFASLKVVNSTFINNSQHAILSYYDDPVNITDSTFTNNNPKGINGAIDHSYDDDLYLSNCNIDGDVVSTPITDETVFRTYTTLTLNVKELVTINNNVTITGYLENSENWMGVVDAIITIIIDNTEYSTTTDDDGNYKYSFIPTTAGETHITVSYDGNETYKASTAETTIEVISKIITKMYVYYIDSTTIGENVTIRGYLADDNNNRISNTEIVLDINGEEYNVRTDSSGGFSYVYTTKIVGINNVTAILRDNDDYRNSNMTRTFKVYLNYDLSLNFEDYDSFYVGDEINITGVLTNNSQACSNANINIRIYKYIWDDVTLLDTNVTTDENGIYQIKYTPTSSYSDPYIRVSFTDEVGDEHAQSRYFSILSPYTLTMNVNNEQSYYIGENITVNGTLTRRDVAVADVPVTVSIHYDTYWDDEIIVTTNVVTDENGYYSYKYTVPEDLTTFGGNYKVVVTYDDVSKSQWIEIVNKTAPTGTNINVSNYAELMSAVDAARHSNNNMTINLLPGEYNITSTIEWRNSNEKTLTINGNGNTVNGKDYYRFLTIVNANAIINNITVVNCSNQAIYITDSNVTINNSVFENNTGYYGRVIRAYENNNLTVENSIFINNNDGEGYEGGVFNIGENNHVTINNSTFTNNTAQRGGAIYLWDSNRLDVNNSVFTDNSVSDIGGAIYGGWDNFANINNSKFINNTKPTLSVANNLTNTTIDEGQASTTIELSPISTKNVGVPVVIEGKLYEKDTFEGIANVNIDIMIDDVLYVSKITDDMGRFSYEFTPEHSGAHDILVKFDGTETYSSSSVRTSCYIKQVPLITIAPVAARIGQSIELSATIQDEYGNDVNEGKTIFKINGKSLKDENGNYIYCYVRNGRVSMNYTVPSFWLKYDNTIELAFSETAHFVKANVVSYDVSILPRNWTVTLDKVQDAYEGEILKITIHTLYDNGTAVDHGKMIIKINGRTVRDENNEDIVYPIVNGVGTYSYPVNLAAGTYNLTVVTSSDELGWRTNTTLKVLPNEYYSKLYASSSGTGNGLTFDNPTDLTTALEMVENNGTIYLVTSGTTDVYDNEFNIRPFNQFEVGCINLKEGTHNFSIIGWDDKNITFNKLIKIDSANVTIKNLYFNGAESGLIVRGANYDIYNCTFIYSEGITTDHSNYQENTGSTHTNMRTYTFTSTNPTNVEEEIVIENCTFINCKSAIDNKVSNTKIIGNTFINNTEHAIISDLSDEEDSNILIANNTFIDNKDGAVNVNTDNSTIQNNTFINNTSPDKGGAISDEGYSSTIEDNTFIGNSANEGGAIYKKYNYMDINKNTFEDNTANTGSILYSQGSVTLTNNEMTDNAVIGENGKQIEFQANPSDPAYQESSGIQLTSNDNTINYNSKINDLITPGMEEEFIDNNEVIDVSENTIDTITKAVVNTRLADNTSINITLTDIDSNAINNAKVTILEGDRQIASGTTDVNGKVTVKLDLTGGNHKLNIKYGGNSTYNPSNTTLNINVEKLNTNVNAIVNKNLVDNTSITVTLTDTTNNKKVSNAPITILEGDRQIASDTTDVDGKVTVKLDLAVGGHLLNITYDGNGTYNPSNTTLNINVEKLNTKVSAVVNKNLVDNTSVTVTLTDTSNNKAVSNAPITILEGSKQIASGTTDVNGKAAVKLDLTSGSHALNIKYGGNATYNPSSTTLNINVEKLNTKVSAVVNKNLVDNTSITVTLTDTTNNKAVSNAPVSILEGNKQIASVTTDVNGKAAVKLDLTSGSHALSIKYGGNDTYNPSSTTLNINVEKLNTKVSAVVNKNLVDNTSITVTLTDTTYNKAVSNAPVSILEGSKQIASVTTDVNGKATVKLSLTSGNHALNIKYNGNATYKASENNVNINVVKLATTVTMNAPSTTNVGDMFTVNVTVKDQNNKAATGNVTIKVGNNTQSLPLTNGQASLPASINTTGKQDIIATYNGNEYNLASSKTTSITVNPAPTTTTITITNNTAGNVRVSGTVKDKSNRPVTTGTVTIKNGNTIVGTGQLTNGIYNILTNIGSAGSYPLTAQYSGSNNYLASSANTNVNVAFKTPSMTATVNGDKIGKTNVTATVKDPSGTGLNGVPIIVTLPNGTNITGTTGNNGVANIPVDVRENGTLTINYPGNGTYKAVSTSKPVSVTKNNPVIRLNPVKGVIGEDITLTAYLEDADGTPITGGNLAFKLNGKTLRSDGRFDSKAPAMKFKVENGLVTYKIKADLYLRNAKNLTASYSGNYKYVELNSESVEAQIQKRYAQVTTTVTPRIVKQYATLQLTATVKDITKNGKNTTLINQDTKVMFKVNGVTLKDSNGKTLYVPVGKNNKAVYNYIVPAGTGGITASKKVRDYKVDAIFMGDNYYPGARNVTTFNVERSATYVGITQVKASKTNVLSVSATLKDYKGNYLIGTNKVTIKINGKNYVNPATGKAVYWSVKDGKVSLSGIQVDPKTTIKRVMIVTGERQAYLEGRNETTNIIRA